MARDTTKVVFAALAGNVLVAVSKFGAAYLSGSSAMLTEAIHSSADTANQVLLLIGTKRSRTRPDASHTFGYGMEVYFWTFVVAVIILLAGGVASIWHGASQLAAPTPINSAYVSLGVLLLAALFEGSSLAVGYREYKRVVAGRKERGKSVSMWRFIALSKDPNLYETLLEDSAALAGIAIAALGVLCSAYLHLLWADGVASVAIGLLLLGNSLVVAEATRSLMAGESVTPPVLQAIRARLKEEGVPAIAALKTLHLGPTTIIVTLTLGRDLAESTDDLLRALELTENRVRLADPRIRYVYFSFKGSGDA